MIPERAQDIGRDSSPSRNNYVGRAEMLTTLSQITLWIFKIATAIVAPIVLIVVVETVLRLFNVGYQSDFTVPCTVLEHKAVCDNDHFTWQFFPPGAFRLPSSFAIPAEKPAGTFRIFIVGESAAQGVPEPAYAFSRYLEAMLRDHFPMVRFEVINASITATNSHVLLPVVRDLAQREGDLFVLYIGNNEVVGPYGAGTTLTRQAGNLTLIRAAIWLKSTRLGQLLGAVLSGTRPANTPRQWRGMEMFLDQQVPADASTLSAVYDNFEQNLRDIVTVAKGSGAHVLVSTVGVNLKDSAPFASLHRTDLTHAEQRDWEDKVSEGIALESTGQNSEAVDRYLSAAVIDDRFAELQYRIGRVFWTLGKFDDARKRFLRARDLDTLRFRADDRINDIIRSVALAAGPGVELVDAAKLFADSSPHGVPGDELFYEHVHMNPHGNYLLARSLFSRVAELLPHEVQRSVSTLDAPTEEESERLLALTPHDRKRVAQTVIAWLSEPPFTSRLNNDEQLQMLAQQIKVTEDSEATSTAYRWAIAKAPDDRWLHFNFGRSLEAQNPTQAAAEFERALELLPRNYEVRQKLADALTELGNYAAAIGQCQQLLKQMPYHSPAYLTMAYAQAQLGSLEESIASYEKAIKLQPDYALDAYTNIGLMQLRQGKFDQAAASFKKAIAVDTGQVRTNLLRDRLDYALRRLNEASQAKMMR